MPPIVHRELRVAARNPKLYSHRLRWGVAQMMVACGVLLLSAGGFRPSTAQWFFTTLSYLALFLCLLEGVRKTSDAISSEKRQGTLGFLFLSNLKGVDVVLGKFSGAFVRSASALLPFFPILALSLLVGGTTLGEFWRVACGLVSVLAASLSLCLLVSTLSRENSIVAAIVVLCSLWTVPSIASFVFKAKWIASINPFALLRSADDWNYSLQASDYWTGIASLWLVALFSLVLASFIVPKVWQERTRNAHSTASQSPGRARRRAALLDQNPVLWLNCDERGRGLFTALAIALLLGGLGPLVALIIKVGDSALWAAFPMIASAVLSLLIWMRVVIQTAPSIAEARRSGLLELLLSTPITVDEVVRGYWLALWRSLRVPVICMVLLLACALATASLSSVGQAIWTSKFLIELLLQIPVLASVGMWMGLTSKTRAAAVVYTILLGGLVPWIVCIFTILIQIVLIFRGIDRVKSVLRRIRSGQHQIDLHGLLRQPRLSPHRLPPVIR